jgi:hypothetical protein
MKKATKKTTKKKVAVKRPERSAVAQSFNILSPDGVRVRSSVIEALKAQSERTPTRPTSFRSMADMQQEFVPVDHFLMQYLLDSYGFPLQSFTQIIGDSKLGKTTMGHYVLGCAVRRLGCPVLAIHWGVKPFLRDRALRTYSSNPHQAQQIAGIIDVETVSTLTQMEEALNRWVTKWREVGKIPTAVPLVVLIDNITKYLSPEESAGVVNWGTYMKDKEKKKKKDTGGGSNFSSAKWIHAWTRRLADVMATQNVTVLTVADQNDDIDMGASGGGGMTLSEKVATLYNDTHRGGRGMKQMAASRLIFGRDALVKNTDQTNRGVNVNIRNAKSNFGADERKIRAELRVDHGAFDVPGYYLDPAWHMDESMGLWFADKGYFGTTISRGKFTAEPLGVFNASPEELSIAFHGNAALKQELGELLRIQGYFSVVDKIVNAKVEHETD